MRKWLAIMAVCLFAGIGFTETAGSFIGRKDVSFTTNKVVAMTSQATPVRVGSLAINYPAGSTNVFTYSAMLDGVTFWSNSYAASNSLVLYPVSLWLKPTDTLVLSNSVSNATSVVIDLLGN